MTPPADLLGAARARGVPGDRVVLSAPAIPGGAGERPAVGEASSGGGDPALLALDALDALVDRRAATLRAQGVQPGRIHPVVVEPDVDGVVTLLALWRVGAVPAPLNPRLTEPERAAATAALARVAPGDAQVVLWTSGTSGRPRGVALPWSALSAHVDATVARLGLDPSRDRWLASLSLAHVGGLMAVVRGILTGSEVVAAGTVAPALLPHFINGTAGVEPVTHLSLVPTQLRRVLDAVGEAPPPSTLRCVLLGGAHTPRPLLERAHAAGWPVALTYGMTEMSSQVATATPAECRAKPGSVGKLLPGVELRVGADGQLLVRGATLASAYLDGNPLADADGWYATGDLGWVDDEGDVWITGRVGDRIISGGVNVDPAEVEEALRLHPAVADACVVGVSDPEWGEAVAVWVVPVAGEFDLDQVQEWLRDRLAGPKRPRVWTLGGALPINANGKVDRQAVRRALSGP